MTIPSPNYTQIPNVLLDELAKTMKDAELRVILAICRKTFGWHKTRDKISLTQLQKMTGLSRQGVINGIEAGVDRKIIIKESNGQGFIYELIIEETSQRSGLAGVELVNEVDQFLPVTSQRSGHTKESNLKKSLSAKNADKPDPEYIPVQEGDVFNLAKKKIEKPARKERSEIGQFVDVLSDVTGMNVEINRGRLLKVAKRIMADPKASPEIIRSHYLPGGLWYQEDWRGKKGQKPTPEDVASTLFALNPAESDEIEMTLTRRSKV